MNPDIKLNLRMLLSMKKSIVFFTSPSVERTLEFISIDEKPDFDVVIVYYKTINEKSTNNSLKLNSLKKLINFKTLFFNTEGKGEILCEIDNFMKSNQLYFKYKYIGILDDDLKTCFSGLNQSISIAKKLNLDSFQPSLTHDSYYAHEFTLSRVSSLIHYVPWIEIMSPFYDTNLFQLSSIYFQESISSWGLDCYVFPLISRINLYSKHAVIDKVKIKHLRELRSNKKIYSNGLNANEEMIKIRLCMIKLLINNYPKYVNDEYIQRILELPKTLDPYQDFYLNNFL